MSNNEDHNILLQQIEKLFIATSESSNHRLREILLKDNELIFYMAKKLNTADYSE